MLKYLIEKEFKQFFRNSFLPRLIIVFPIMIMLVMPWVATLDIRGVNVTVADSDRSTLSSRLIEKINASEYFSVRRVTLSYADALEDVDDGLSDLVLDIPSGYADSLGRGKSCKILVAVNAVNGTKGYLGGNYMAGILSGTGAGVDVSVLNMYNPTLNYRQFMIPAFLAVLIMMLCGFLPALNIVSEKEKGTIEQINVTPVGKFQFIFAKLIPYWLIGFVVLAICFLLGWLVYGYLPAGSFIVILAGTFVFILGISSIGLIISNYSQSMQQSMLVMFFFILIFNLMSGLFTPVRSMPGWAQTIAACIPPKYFIEILRGVYQRGCGFSDLGIQFAALTIFAVFFGLSAVLTYRKRA
ncbi:MAG: ABC transporter permease [Bacteroidales bacterium]|jgi:ABC-2 type transport system permease protein|nr:ABC transporter permease [Bacteroidales bacterium]